MKNDTWIAKYMNGHFKENEIQMVIENMKRCSTSLPIKGMKIQEQGDFIS